MVFQSLKSNLQVLDMLRKGLVVDQNIVEEDDDELSQNGTESRIHSSLEGQWRITKAKWHHQEFIVAMVCSKCHFAYILRSHPNLVIPL